MKNPVGTVRHLASMLLLRAKNSRDTIFGHHWNQKAAISRAAEAKAWGLLPLDWMLPPKDWPTPFTQQSVTIDDHSKRCGTPWLKWLWIPAALAGIGGVTYVIWPELFSVVPVIVKQPGTPGKTLIGDADVIAGEISVKHKEDR